MTFATGDFPKTFKVSFTYDRSKYGRNLGIKGIVVSTQVSRMRLYPPRRVVFETNGQFGARWRVCVRETSSDRSHKGLGGPVLVSVRDRKYVFERRRRLGYVRT